MLARVLVKFITNKKELYHLQSLSIHCLRHSALSPQILSQCSRQEFTILTALPVILTGKESTKPSLTTEVIIKTNIKKIDRTTNILLVKCAIQDYAY